MKQFKLFDKKGRPFDEHSDALEQVAVFDNQGKTFDRYLVTIGDESFVMSHNPMSPQGVNQSIGPKEYGKRIPWNIVGALGTLLDHIPPEIEPAILERIEDKRAKSMPTKVYPKTSKEYADSNGALCPYCSSKYIQTTGPVDIGTDGTGYQRIACQKCQRRWYDKYRLVGFIPSK